MDLNTVFTKTSKGAMEVAGKSRELSREQSRILTLVDGKSTIGEILDKAGRMTQGKLEQLLGALAADGFIRILRGSGQTHLVEELGFSSTIIVDEANTQAFFEAQAAHAQRALKQVENEKASKEQERQELLAELKAEAEAAERAKARAEAAAQAKADAERKAREAAEQKAADEARRKTDAERRARLEAEIQAKTDVERKAREEAERKAAEESKARAEAEARAREQAEAAARLEAEAKEITRKEAEAKAKAEAEARARAETEARMREAEAARRKVEEEKQLLARQLEEARLAAELEARAKRRIEARAREEEETRQRIEAEARAKLEEETRRRAEAEEKARAAAEAQRLAEEAAKARAEAERKAREEAEARAAAEAQARAEAEKRAREEAAARAKSEAEAKARAEAEAKAVAERKAREEAEAQAKAEKEARRKAQEEEAARQRAAAETKAREEAEARAKQEAAAKAEAERKTREEEAARQRAEAEARERAEAERQAREQAEAKARMDEEARRVEAEIKAATERAAREDAEAKARESAEKDEAERRARELAEERARAEAAAAAREEERLQAKAAAVNHARMEAEEARRRAEEQERFLMEEEIREREEADTRAQALAQAMTEEQAAFERALGTGRSRAGVDARKWLRYGGIGGFALLLLVFLVAHVIPFTFHASRLEQQIAQALGERVKIGELRFSAFPAPHWKMERIALGGLDDIKIAKGELQPALGDWFSDSKLITRVSLDGVTIHRDSLGKLPLWFARQPKAPLKLARVDIKQIKLEGVGIELPNFDARMDMNSGVLGRVVLTTSDQRATVEIEPMGAASRVRLQAQKWAPPFGINLQFDQLEAQGMARGQTLELENIYGTLHGGTLQGSGRVGWEEGWQAALDIELKRINLADAMALFTHDIHMAGELEAKAVISSEAAGMAGLLAAPQVRATFLVRDGLLGNVDMVRAINAPARSTVSGGQTRFNDFSGYLQLAKGVYQYRQLRLSMGMLSASGAVEIQPDKMISGTVASELKSKTTAIRVPLTVSGSLATPTLRGGAGPGPVRPKPAESPRPEP